VKREERKEGRVMVEGVGAVENHREREKGVLVYPVYSRRSEGLSVGINLFPDRKRCSFDCPYCEVFPFSTNAVFSVGQMESDLRDTLATASERGIPVKDICFSGNGEPSLSPYFPVALEKAASVRAEIAPNAELVLITNGTGLLDDRIFSLLRDAALSYPLNIWLKVDAGTPRWYQKINRSEIPFENTITKIKEFAARAPVTVQTMVCAVDGEGPPPDEARAWELLILELVAIAAGNGISRNGAGGIRKVQIYGKARPSPEGAKTSALPVQYLEDRAASLRSAFAVALAGAFASDEGLLVAEKGVPPEVKVFP
jgi:histidinol dehydrogenase